MATLSNFYGKDNLLEFWAVGPLAESISKLQIDNGSRGSEDFSIPCCQNVSCPTAASFERNLVCASTSNLTGHSLCNKLVNSLWIDKECSQLGFSANFHSNFHFNLQWKMSQKLRKAWKWTSMAHFHWKAQFLFHFWVPFFVLGFILRFKFEGVNAPGRWHVAFGVRAACFFQSN